MSTAWLGGILLGIFFLGIYLLCSKLPETDAGKEIHDEMIRMGKR